MIEKQNNPHDKFFKEIFSRKQEAQSFINDFLPKQLVDKLVFDDFEIDSNSYIDETLQESFADIVYNCTYSKQKIKIAFLFEHKTFQDKNIYLQLLRYMLNIWETEKKDKKRQLTVVLPIVIYHGRKQWKLNSFYANFGKIDSELHEFIPHFSYLLQDLHAATQTEILEKYHSIILQTSFLLMKNIFDKFALIENIDKIFEKLYLSAQITDNQVIQSLYYYLFHTNSAEQYVELTEKIRKLPNSEKDMKTIADVLIDKGRQEGRQEGWQEGRQEGWQEGRQEGRQEGIQIGHEKTAFRSACIMLLENFDIQMIARVMNLKIERVLELKKLVEKYGANVLEMEL